MAAEESKLTQPYLYMDSYDITIAWACIAIQTSIYLYITGQHTIGQHTTGQFTRKQRAWTLSMIASSVYLCVSPFIIYDFFADVKNGTLNLAISNERYIDRTLIIWLIANFILDIVIGYMHYSEYQDFYICHVHHTYYLILMNYALDANLTRTFVILLPLEIPNFFRAIGTIWPNLRNDIVFGSTFFMTRIVYEIVAAYYLYYTTDFPKLVLIICTMLTLPIHSLWFYKWCLMYAKGPKSLN